jgi:hypothetical protein
MWSFIPIVPATQEAEGTMNLRSGPQVNIGRPYFKDKIQKTGLVAWLKC